MKSIITLSLVAGVFVTTTLTANAQMSPEKAQKLMERNLQASNDAELDNAIRTRQRNYMMEKIRDNNRKNIKNQWMRHTISKAESGVDTVNTMLLRSGELTDYEGVRPFTYSRITVPNNAKRNFRTRAYDYYIEGGDAGADVLESDVVLSSEHSPYRRRYHSNNVNTADIISSIREIQRNRRSNDRVPTGEQRMTFRTGDSQRNFLHPFMDFNLNQ